MAWSDTAINTDAIGTIRRHRRRDPDHYALSDRFKGVSKMGKIRRTLIILMSVALLAAACGDDDSGGNGDGNGGFSSEIKDRYLEGCETSQNRAFCECTLDEIEKRFSEEDFIRFAIEASEDPPEEFVEIAFACLDEADLGG